MTMFSKLPNVHKQQEPGFSTQLRYPVDNSGQGMGLSLFSTITQNQGHGSRYCNKFLSKLAGCLLFGSMIPFMGTEVGFFCYMDVHIPKWQEFENIKCLQPPIKHICSPVTFLFEMHTKKYILHHDTFTYST